MGFLRRLGRAVGLRPDAAKVPDGMRVYAIGDIHGRFDLLEALHAMVAADLAEARPARSIGVFLGDYVDRGPSSREVIEWLSAGNTAFDELVCLKGNHDALLEEFLSDPAMFAHLLQLEGLSTIRSYGVEPDFLSGPHIAAETHERFLAAFPDHHGRFLSSLGYHHTIGDYFFAHAGVRPGVPLERQEPEDLIWIRDPFLNSRRNFGSIVVHGHTPCDDPEVRANRINIDTGACFSGVLSCLVLEGAERRFLQTR